jgi:hypothetical protein
MNVKSITEAAKLPHKTIYVAVIEGSHPHIQATLAEYLRGTVVERVEVKDDNTFVYFVAGERQSLSGSAMFEDNVTNINTGWVVAETPITLSAPVESLTPVTPSTKIPTDVKVSSAPIALNFPAFTMKAGVVK